MNDEPARFDLDEGFQARSFVALFAGGVLALIFLASAFYLLWSFR